MKRAVTVIALPGGATLAWQALRCPATDDCLDGGAWDHEYNAGATE